FVTDHCAAIWRVMQEAACGTTYNVGGHNELPNLHVVEKICDLVDAKAPPLADGKPRRSLITYVKDRPGHDRRYAIDCSKIERDLSWTPAETFSSGFERTVAWYLENATWCAQVRSGDYQKWIATHYA
ncbi:MAG: GDP-mannose 4,6-dehydratase, partial [Kiritimatiellae bacterium]|nr:GDP-mannose 4,6-dehydratase [Kiritimatiellia bacterium]